MANLTAAPTSQNALHGKLSQILVLLEESVAGLTYTPGKGLVDYIRQAQDSMLARNPCGPTQALFVQVVQAVRAKTPDLPADVFATTDDFCRQRVQSTFDAAPAPGADAANLAAARYIIALHEPPSLLESPNPEVVEIALSEPTFTSASLEQRMAIAGIAVSAESNQRARLEALAWAHRYSQQDFTKVPPSRWDRILAEFEQSRNQPLRQALLAVLGKAIGQVRRRPSSSPLKLSTDFPSLSSPVSVCEPGPGRGAARAPGGIVRGVAGASPTSARPHDARADRPSLPVTSPSRRACRPWRP